MKFRVIKTSPCSLTVYTLFFVNLVYCPLQWLQAYYPERLVRIYEAEEVIQALEHQGITGGQEYEEACKELFMRFEEARRLKFRAGGKIWWE
jgi:hypothetical protein